MISLITDQHGNPVDVHIDGYGSMDPALLVERLRAADNAQAALTAALVVLKDAKADAAALIAENAALRALVADFERHVNQSVSGMPVGMMTWLDLITRAQRTLEGGTS